MTTSILIGIFSGALALMLVHWMQPSHIFDFIPKWFVKVPEGLSDQEIVDHYWANVKGNFPLRVCICETCLSVYVFAVMFAIFGQWTLIDFIAGLSSTYIVIRYAP